MKRALIAIVCAGLLSALALPAVGVSEETTEVVKARGTLEPMECVDVGAQAAGVIIRLGDQSDYGKRVTKGTMLAQIDPAAYEIQLSKVKAGLAKAEAGVQLAKAKVELAKVKLQQAEKKRSEERPSDWSDTETLKAALSVAEAELADESAEIAIEKTTVERAELDLARCTIRSPVDGVILARRCDVGQTTSMEFNSPSLFLIACDLKKLQFWMSVRERDIGKVAVGQEVKFTVEAFPEKEFTGKVMQIRLNAGVIKNDVFYTVVADMNNTEDKLIPYLTGDAEIIAARNLADR